MPCTRYATVNELVRLLLPVVLVTALYRLGATPCEDQRDKDGGDKSIDEESGAHERPTSSSKVMP